MNNGYSKVILRCMLYPSGKVFYIYKLSRIYVLTVYVCTVPLLTNIFGLILQLIIITSGKDEHHYGLAMTHTLFSGTGGVFVAVIFFTDPTVTSFKTE
jgi:hypothetical protein